MNYLPIPWHVRIHTRESHLFVTFLLTGVILHFLTESVKVPRIIGLLVSNVLNNPENKRHIPEKPGQL